MKIISSKQEVKVLIEKAIDYYRSADQKSFMHHLHFILKMKIRFPLLEYAAKELYEAIPEKEQIALADNIVDMQEIGSNVIAGILLQLRLNKHFRQSLAKACDYIVTGDQWYVCDIIGERVMGYALLTMPERTIPELKLFIAHENKWIVRSVGVAAHYAVKKGLEKRFSEQMFQILLLCSGTTDFHTKKGIGWAAKTIAKFHPDIIAIYKDRLENDPAVKTWFKTKIRIGLGRSFKYAGKYSG